MTHLHCNLLYWGDGIVRGVWSESGTVAGIDSGQDKLNEMIIFTHTETADCVQEYQS